MRVVHCVAVGAALITLAICIWLDAAVTTSLGRVVIAYLTTFAVGVVGVIGLRAADLPKDETATAVGLAGGESLSGSDDSGTAAQRE